MTAHASTGKIVFFAVGGREILTTDPAVDPSSSGVAAPIGSVYLGTTATWIKTGAGDTAWVAFSTTTAVAPISDGIYGSGFNGAVTDAVDRTLTENLALTNFTINPGVIITGGRCSIVCNGTLTIGAGAAIRANGANGSGTAGGAGGGTGGAGTLGLGTAGGPGGTPPAGGGAGTTAAQQPRGIGTTGRGGTGGNGGAGGTLTEQSVASGNPFIVGPTLGYFPTIAGPIAVAGGSGGGGGASGGASGNGGGGGGGGGVLVIIAKNIVNNGAIEAKGGNGAAGTANNGNGGGGGGGGKVFIVCRTYTGAQPDVSGGTGGAGVGTGVAGANGNAGAVFTLTM